ncbi:MAG: aldose epimerase [Sphingobacteriaceae bacterium]|jgi:aldose 1-epimerase|nr:aldose epimerase [Sphingobacteriaceae bacterium]
MRKSFLTITKISAITACAFFFACKARLQPSQANLLPNKAAFKETVNGGQTELFHLRNKNNMQVAVTSYGARLVELIVPDKNNNPTGVVLGFDSVKQFIKASAKYYGGTIGRYANRIADGKMSIDGVPYNLSVNSGVNSMHGGKNGFNLKLWKLVESTPNSVTLSYFSKDGEEGFPGNMTAKVKYEVTDNNELKFSYEAVTDKKTVVNLTNHAFFNMNGEGSGEITDHLLKINADKFTPLNENLIPTGELRNVANTAFDFRTATAIGARINDNDPQLKYATGYDHNYVLNGAPGKLNYAATITGIKSGISMDIYTDQPGLQFYSGNFFKGQDVGRSGKTYEFRSGFCLETQHFPDSPNHANFPSTILNPGETFKSTSIYKFSAK